MLQAIERVIALPFVIIGAFVNAVVRPVADFGMQHVALIALTTGAYLLVEPYWPELMRILQIY